MKLLPFSCYNTLTEKESNLNTIFWDIEASNLAADFGIILCVGMKSSEKGKIVVPSLLDYPVKDGDLFKAEKELLTHVSNELLKGDMWVTHFGTHYDIPFLNARLLFHHLPVLPPNYAHVDTWKVSRNRLKLSNNRLKTIQNFFGTEDQKNEIKPGMWIRALGGHAPSMRYIVDHCRRDVAVLEEAYTILRPLVLDHPNHGLVSGSGGCGVCGSKKMQKRGFHITRTRRYQRLQCQECGHWSRDVKPIEVLK